MKPKRIQRKRTRGWRMPVGAVYVGRPTKWGNPWRIGKQKGTINGEPATLVLMPHYVLDCYRKHVLELVAAGELDLEELRGKDLACWCSTAPGTPCHADVLLELANR